MTGEQATSLLEFAYSDWPHMEIPESQYASWTLLLQPYKHADALPVLTELLRQKREFPPKANEITSTLKHSVVVELRLPAPHKDAPALEEYQQKDSDGKVRTYMRASADFSRKYDAQKAEQGLHKVTVSLPQGRTGSTWSR